MTMHTSRQWQVGHGGFCTTEISSERNGLPPIRYVYDCEAMHPRDDSPQQQGQGRPMKYEPRLFVLTAGEHALARSLP